MDLSRTEFFVNDFNEKESYDFCFGILYWWSVQKKDLGYRQGMNEIMAVLMKTVFEYESNGGLEANPLGDNQETSKEDHNEDKQGDQNQDNETSGQIAKTQENQEPNAQSNKETTEQAGNQEIENELEISNPKKAIQENKTNLPSHSPNKAKHSKKLSKVELQDPIFDIPQISANLDKFLLDREFACAILFEKMLENGVDKIYRFEAKGVKHTELYLHQSVKKIFKKRLKVYQTNIQ